MVAETFSARLRRLRAAAGLSQNQLADAAGIPAGTIRNWEHGRREPYIGTVNTLATALGVSVADLMAGLIPAPPKERGRPKGKAGKK